MRSYMLKFYAKGYNILTRGYTENSYQKEKVKTSVKIPINKD